MEEIGVGDGGLPGELSPFPEAEVEGRDEEEDGLFYPEQKQKQKQKKKQKEKLRPIRSNNVHTTSQPYPYPYPYPFDFGLGGFEGLDELVKFKTQVDAHFMSNLNHQFTQHGSLSCCCSDSDSDSASASASPHKLQKRKRKRKRKKMESYVQELMRQVMEKQEQMQQQLMDVIQNKEKERLVREEQWRHQQMLRLNNDHHIRSQQAARSLALISFIRNTLPNS